MFINGTTSAVSVKLTEAVCPSGVKLSQAVCPNGVAPMTPTEPIGPQGALSLSGT
jgi:hypothetical protein